MTGGFRKITDTLKGIEMTDPILSIIMPVRNNERFFPNAVKSILQQDFRDWELIIIEGLSTDDTADIADSFAQSDERIRTYHAPGWIYEAINMGIGLARGEYFTVLNSDDAYDLKALEAVSQYMKRKIDLILLPVITVKCDGKQNRLSDNKDKVVGKLSDEFVIEGSNEVRDRWLFLLKSGLLDNQLNIYRMECIEGLLFRQDVYGADYLYNLRALPRVKSVAYTPAAEYFFYQYLDSDGMNTSVGKFYDYTGRMFDDFYFEALNLFAMYGKVTEDVMNYLMDRRINHFLVELGTYNYDSCPLSIEEKFIRIFRSVGDKKDFFIKAGIWEKMEQVVIDLCRNIVIAMDDPDAGSMQIVKLGINEISLIGKKEYYELDVDLIVQMVLDPRNPAHIGATICSRILDAIS